MEDVPEVATNKQVIFKDYVSGLAKESDIYVTTGAIELKGPEGCNGVLVQNLYLSCDPYMRILMGKLEDSSVFSSYAPASLITGYGVAKVLDSRLPDFKKGDLVWGTTRWEEYSVITAPEGLFKILHTDVPLSYCIGVLGMPGMTAYFGFYEVCSPKRGDCVFISSAFGPVGQLVGQFAKLMGCYVVGSAGSAEKPIKGFAVAEVLDSGDLNLKKGDLASVLTGWEENSLLTPSEILSKIQETDVPLSYYTGILVETLVLTNKLGFDEAFNYKEEQDYAAALNRLGKVVLRDHTEYRNKSVHPHVSVHVQLCCGCMRMNRHIAVRGMISQYNLAQSEGVHNFMYLATKQIRAEGFIMVLKHHHLYPEYLEMVLPNTKQGKIVYVEDIAEGMENGAAALVGLFSRRNVGKQVIAVAKESTKFSIS